MLSLVTWLCQQVVDGYLAIVDRISLNNFAGRPEIAGRARKPGPGLADSR